MVRFGTVVRVDEVGAWWRRRRVDLSGLSPLDLVLFWGAVAVAVVAFVVIVLSTIGVAIPGGVDFPAAFVQPADGACEVAASSSPVPRLITLLPFVALAIAGPALLRGAQSTQTRAIVAFSVGSLGIVFSSALVMLARWQSLVTSVTGGSYAFLTWPAAVAGYVGLVAAVAVTATSIPPIRRALSPVAPVLAALPFLLVLLVYVLDPLLDVSSPGVAPTVCIANGATGTTALGGWSSPHGPLLLALQRPSEILRVDGLLQILGFWFAIEGARTTRDAARWWSMRLPVRGASIPTLLAVTGCWLLLGLGGRLPSLVGGDAPQWVRSRADGPVAWVVAAGIVVLLGVWLTRGTRAVREEGFRTATTVLFLAFAAAPSLLLLFFLVLNAGVDLNIGPAGAAVSGLSENEAVFGSITSTVLWSWVLLLLIALPVGFRQLRMGRFSAGLFWIAIGVWGAPRAVEVSLVRLGLTGAETGGSWSPEPLTLTVMVVVGLGLLLLLSNTRRFSQRVDRESIVMVTIAFGLVAFVPVFVPDAWADAVFGLTLAFPLVATLLWDAGPINRSGQRQRVVPAVAALGAALLAFAASTAATYGLDSGARDFVEVGRLLLTMPFVILLLLVAISDRYALGDAFPVGTGPGADGQAVGETSDLGTEAPHGE